MKKKGLVFVLSVMTTLALVACGKKEEEVVEEEYVRPSVIGDVSETTLKVNPNGTFVEIACEDFSDSDVDVSGLEAFINSEIDAYNDEAGVSKISLVEYQEDNGVVKTAIQYSDTSTYNSFNMMDLVVALYDNESADEITKAEIASAQEATPVVTTTTTEINEEELMEAGYSLEDIEEIKNGTLDTENATETDATATFTDASNSSVVNSEDISGDSIMMLITSEPMTYTINGGKILYYDKHAELIDSSTVVVDGKGKSVIVYQFNY